MRNDKIVATILVTNNSDKETQVDYYPELQWSSRGSEHPITQEEIDDARDAD